MNYPLPQQGYAPAPQGYPPQQAQPQYPQYPAQQGYAPAPAYAPAGYPPQQAQQPVQQPLATGTIDDYYSQPSVGGGPSLKFEQVGTRYVGTVARAISNGDIQQQTNIQGVPQTYRDGRPKFVMKVPLVLPASDGSTVEATWFVKGQAREELSRAMAEAQAPVGPPEAGAIIDVTFSGTKSSGAGFNPAKLFQIRYTRPAGSAGSGAPSLAPEQQAPVQQIQSAPAQPAPQQAQLPTAPVPAAAPAQYAPVQQPAQAAPQYPQPAQQPVAQAQPAQVVPQAPTPAPQPVSQPAAQMPADFTPEQQALMARLTQGQQQAQQA